MEFKREEHVFDSQGVKCAGWLYRPVGMGRFPAVIMAHGLGAERGFRLPAFAERFAAEGMAVFLFDYRFFGDSEGMPRQLINPFHQLKDWEAALAYVKGLPDVDISRIGLFGTSFSGGHVIVTASRHPEIRAIVAQLPFVDALSSMAMAGISNIVKGSIAAMRDIGRLLTFREPYYVPLVAEPGTYAFMNTADAASGYLALVPKDTSWRNRAPARLGLVIGAYRPIRFAHRVACPCLMVLAEKESLISPEATEKTAARMPDCTLLKLPCGHFEPYDGPLFEEVVRTEAEFLARHLLGT